MIKLDNMCMDSPVKKAAIIHPGAIGDCILTLPFISLLKHIYKYNQIHFIGHTEYISIYPGRTCIDNVRPIEMFDLYHLFNSPQDFNITACSKLINVLSEYDHIISFLGSDNEYFEENLNFAVHCTHSADVTLLPLPENENEHVSSFYVQQFAQKNLLDVDSPNLSNIWISPRSDDIAAGCNFLNKFKIAEEKQVCLIHPGSGGSAKCWPLDNYLKLANLLITDSIAPVFLIGPVEKERIPANNLDIIKQHYPVFSDISLDDVVRLLSVVDCVVGNDNGICHLSGAMGKKTVVLFGTSNPLQYRPLGPNVKVIHFEKEEFNLLCSQKQLLVKQGIQEMLY